MNLISCYLSSYSHVGLAEEDMQRLKGASPKDPPSLSYYGFGGRSSDPGWSGSPWNLPRKLRGFDRTA